MADWKLSPADWCHVDVVAGDRARAERFPDGNLIGLRHD
jgi:hypothetical protein